MSLLGIDIGTSAIKGVLIDDAGAILGHARRGYRIMASEPGRAELQAMRVWTAVRGVIGSLARAGEAVGSPTRAICVGGSGDEVVAVDARGRSVCPVIMAVDDRSAPEGREIADACGAQVMFARTGLWDLAATPAARFHWLEHHEPRTAARVARLLSWPEWVATRLGLPAMVDATLAARTLAYDVLEGGYRPMPCSAARSLDGLLSPVVATGTGTGSVPRRIAESLGLPTGCRFVVGGFDQAMALLGAGALESGVAHDGSGSWEAVSMRISRGPVDARFRDGGWSVGPSATDAASFEVMSSWTAGLALRPGTGPATLDGLSHRLRRAVRGLEALGRPVVRIRATGGGARSDRWLQLKADATGLPVERPAVQEAGAFAAAVLAGSAVGVLPPPEVAIRELVRVARRFEPDPAMSAHDGILREVAAAHDQPTGRDR